MCKGARRSRPKIVVTVMLICSLVGFWGKSRFSVEGIKCNRPTKHTNVCHKEFIILFNILSKKKPTQYLFSNKYFIDADRLIPLVLFFLYGLE